MRLGGDIGRLPIAKTGKRWLTRNDLAKVAGEKQILYFHFDGDFSYDEDLDDVIPRDFNDNFDVSEEILVIPKHSSNLIEKGYLVWPPRREPLEFNTFLSDFIFNLISEIWQGDVEYEDEFRIVGDVRGIEITREITTLYRPVTAIDD